MNKKTLVSSSISSLVLALAAAVAAPAAQAADAKPSRPVAPARNQAAANKALVMKAYQELFGDHDLSALDRYWAKEYIQHNPYMADGTESVRQYLGKLGLLNGPKSKVEFLRVAAEGDLVFLQVREPKTPNSPEMVVVDIFRVEKDKIVEHWDVMQPVPADAVNLRPMY